MATEKNISSRIIHKHDIEANWNKAVNFIPKAGEIIIYDRDETYDYERFKIGDGETAVAVLPFGSIQSDWNQNDETALDYVKNRTHWVDEGYVDFIPVQEFQFSTQMGVNISTVSELWPLVVGETYLVTFDGVEYECECAEASFNGMSSIGLGNAAIYGGGENTGEPFAVGVIADVDMSGIIVADTKTLHTLGIKSMGEIVHKLDSKFLDLPWMPTVEKGTNCINMTELPAEDSTSLTWENEDIKNKTISGDIKIGDIFIVVFDGVRYVCPLQSIAGTRVLGNIGIALPTNIDTGEPFCIIWDEIECYIKAYDIAPHNVVVFYPEGDEDVVTSVISEEFLYAGYAKQVEMAGRNVSGETFTIDDKPLIAGVGAEVFNLISRNTAIGDYSHAEGYYTTASGQNAHAEGSNTTASGDYSHAEGLRTNASGDRSHAEGTFTHASGDASHAEGGDTVAYGVCSHVEGSFSTASGQSAHAEGDSTSAGGDASHAEGYNTGAVGDYQHVQGKWNIYDENNRYAHIVGNGTGNENERSNAHTVDWQGNAWFSGDVYIGSTSGTNQDEGSEKLTKFSDLKDGNNLPEGTPWIEYTEGEVVPSCTLTVNEDEGLAYFDTPFILVAGEIYTVTYNGVPCECIAQIDEEDGILAYILGDFGAISGGISTGEPFYIVSAPSEGLVGIIPLDGSTEITVSISGPIAINHKLPGSLMPYERTHWTEYKNETCILDESIDYQEDGSTPSTSIHFIENNDYRVIFDGVEYICTARHLEEGVNYIGNLQLINLPLESVSNEPFLMVSDPDFCFIFFETGTHSVIIYELTTEIHKLDAKYLPKKFAGEQVSGKKFEIASDEIVAGAGAEIFNNYMVNKATGEYSHAEGCATEATGEYSHAECYGTVASDAYSHAEGYYSVASGAGSHAEGQSTIASGYASHAEGVDAVAYGSSSHAEGSHTAASGDYSHAEGRQTIAQTEASHAEGFETTVTNNSAVIAKTITESDIAGKYGHAEGYGTVSYGAASHAEGNGTTASGHYSHTEGTGTIAAGICSHAEGIGTNSFGIGSHVEGSYTKASGDYSHAEGGETTASGYCSHAEGISTTASGRYSHTEGIMTTASGDASHAEGFGVEASGNYSHAEGQNTQAVGDHSHAEGWYTKASGNFSHVQGKYNIEDTNNIYQHIVGNGSTPLKRSNIHTLDWDGNAWFAGDVFVGSTSGKNKDEGSKKLVTVDELTDYYTKPEVEQFHDEIKDYVDDEVAALVNAAPETLDTLGELAAAFAENKEVVDALDASITNKQDKVSDALILVDTITGKQHKIQIQNGQLVSFEIE